MLSRTEAQLHIEDLRRLQRQVNSVHIAEPLMEYIQDLLTFSRQAPNFANGLSPRAGLALVHAAKAWALMDGRGHALPEDVQEILPAVVAHRLGRADVENTEFECAEQLINAVPIP